MTPAAREKAAQAHITDIKRPPAKLDDLTYKLLRGSPEAVALRTLAGEWSKACDADGLDHSPGCKHQKEAERAHRRFLDAALQFVDLVRRRGSEHMHLIARPGIIDFYPVSRAARAWGREHAVAGCVILVSFNCENLTVQSPKDLRRVITFGPRDATWGPIESEAKRVRYERALRGLK